MHHATAMGQKQMISGRKKNGGIFYDFYVNKKIIIIKQLVIKGSRDRLAWIFQRPIGMDIIFLRP
ncbi:uncharacterized protein Dvar_08310 [Desulfosarcina variabilis str. Montpellier]